MVSTRDSRSLRCRNRDSDAAARAKILRGDEPPFETTDTELSGDGDAASEKPDGLIINLNIYHQVHDCERYYRRALPRRSLQAERNTMLFIAVESCLSSAAVVQPETAASYTRCLNIMSLAPTDTHRARIDGMCTKRYR